ncbi:Uncharacterised protein [Bacteroides uniformis]|uniref:Uncharacterized protein n=1 Tax=Bacteroides uniformis TaxID=820 RepID=A0A174S6L0_BACUN|nr:Uncharacterised protein [Bacteroides uniformis]
MFSRFYRLSKLGLPFCARLGERKYRSEARMIFFQPTQPLLRGRLAQKRGNPRPLPLKSGKTYLVENEKCRPFGLHSPYTLLYYT